MRISILIAAIASLVACGGDADSIESNDDAIGPDPLNEEFGQLSAGWRVRRSASGNRTWGVNSLGNACVTTGVSQTCSWFSSTTTASGENRIKYAIVDSAGDNDVWASDEASQVAADINMFKNNLFAYPNPNMSIVFEQVPAAQASLLINSVSGSASGNAVGSYIGVSFSECQQTIEQVNNTYQYCKKARINMLPTELIAYMAANYTPGSWNSIRRHVVFNALFQVLGLGKQTNNVDFVTYPFFDATSPFFISNEEACRLQTLSGASGFIPPGLLYFEVSPTTCS